MENVHPTLTSRHLSFRGLPTICSAQGDEGILVPEFPLNPGMQTSSGLEGGAQSRRVISMSRGFLGLALPFGGRTAGTQGW